jgi:hypothetical protein
MSQDANKKELEKKAQAYMGDGLVDIMIGLVVLLAGISMLFDFTAFSAIWIILLIPISRSLKRSVTLPRIEQVDFEPAPDTRKRRMGVTLALLGMLALLVMVGFLLLRAPDRLLPGLSSLLGVQPPIIVLSIVLGFVLLGLIYMARGFGAKRFLAYAALVVLLSISSIWIKMEFPFYLILFGTIVLVNGIAILIQFMRRYPKMDHAIQT